MLRQQVWKGPGDVNGATRHTDACRSQHSLYLLVPVPRRMSRVISSITFSVRDTSSKVFSQVFRFVQARTERRVARVHYTSCFPKGTTARASPLKPLCDLGLADP